MFGRRNVNVRNSVSNHYCILARAINDANSENQLSERFFLFYRTLNICAYGHFITKKLYLHEMFLRQIKRIAHESFSVCSLNTKSFYCGLILGFLFFNNYVKISLSYFCQLQVSTFIYKFVFAEVYFNILLDLLD